MKQSLHESLLRSIWRLRDARILFAARLASFAGDGMAMVALLLRLHDLGFRAAAVSGMLIAFSVLAVVLAPLAGTVADRFDSRTVISIATAAQGAPCLGLMASAGLSSTYAWVVLLAAGETFAGPSLGALTPRVVGEELAPRAAAVVQGLFSVATPIGAAAAGVLSQLGGYSVAFAADAGTFGVLVVAILTVRTRRGGARDPGRSAPPGGVAKPRLLDGVRVVRAAPLLLLLIGGLVPFIIAITGGNVVEVFFTRDVII